MNFDDEFLEETSEIGSDELLADDNLRLPDNANTLVRLHAIRAWLKRRQQETSMEIGETALTLQKALQEEPQGTHLRRRERQAQTERTQQQQQAFLDAQQRLRGYEEAEALLEECVTHTTTGERVLVEYYLTLEELVEIALQENEAEHLPRIQAMKDVQHRVEHVGSASEE
jgi:hypothetical protein